MKIPTGGEGLCSLAGQQFICLDSAVSHAFTFTPSLSLYIDYATDDEITRLAERLGEGGSFLIPLGSHPFARKFAWLTDRLGVSWQLSLQQGPFAFVLAAPWHRVISARVRGRSGRAF